MLSALVRFSLKHPLPVLVVAALGFLFGVVRLQAARFDVFPEFVPPQVVIQTEAPGFSAEQVEQLATRPIEESVLGLGALESLRSESTQGLSVITAVFREDADPFVARQLVSERLGELAPAWPAGVRPPRMTPLTSATMDLLKLGLVSSKRSQMALRDLADWTLRPRLLAVPGVARVSVFGGEVRELRIEVLPERLAASGLSITDVLQAARTATGVRPGGFVETRNQRLTVETDGQATDASAIAQAVVGVRNGTPLRIGDLARVSDAPAPAFGDALVQGKPAVVLTISSQLGANTLEATRAVEATLAELQPLLDAEGVTLFPALHRPATFVDTALSGLRFALLAGAFLVVIVLLLFLGHVRSALVSALAIPLSLVSAALVIEALGWSLNVMTLGGLAIAIGEVVDDAVIDLENVIRRLREARGRADGVPEADVIYGACLEVRTSVVHATVVVALAFLPVLALGGVEGRFFAPLAGSYLLAIVASLVVALTVTPALCLVLFAGRRSVLEPPRLQRALTARYRRLLERVLRRPRWAEMASVLAVLGVLALLPTLSGGNFLPEMRESHLVVQLTSAPGTSLQEMARIGRRIAASLLDVPGVATVEQQIGRAELGEDPWGTNRSEFHVELTPEGALASGEAAHRIRDVVAQVPGAETEVLSFLADRIGESIGGETSQLVVDVVGEDFAVLDRVAESVASEIGALPDAADVRIGPREGEPRVSVSLRTERLVALGFRRLDVLDTIETASQGSRAAQLYEGNRSIDVTVRLDPAGRTQPEAFGALLVRGLEGGAVPLRELAHVGLSTGRASILHDAGRRRQTVTANAAGQDLGGFVAAVRQRLAERITLPSGVYLAYRGAGEAQARARSQLLFYGGLAFIAVLLVLAAAVGTIRNVALLALNLPFAWLGGLLAIVLWKALDPSASVSLGSWIGFVTLFGITTRNSLLLFSRFESIATDARSEIVPVEAGVRLDAAVAAKAASERVTAIVMTALVTGLGLLPLALGANAPGREVEGAMAIVILGGLTTSTLLNLFVLPSLAVRFGRFRTAGRPEDAPARLPA